MKTAYLLAFALAAPLYAQTTTTYTGTVKDLTGATVTSGRITWQLNVPEGAVISGIGTFTSSIVSCLIDANGHPVSTSDSVSPCVIMNNTALTPSGTSYTMCYQPNYITPGNCISTFATGGTVDVSAIIPTPATQPNYGVSLAGLLSASDVGAVPLEGGVMTGDLTVTAIDNVPNADLLPGVDIGAKITTQAALMTGEGTIEIPDGSHDFSNTISITQGQFNQLTLHCHSRNGILNYTGTGDAIYITSVMNSAAQVVIDNCTIQEDALGGSSANGIHLFDAQNVRLNNVLVYNFQGDNLYAVGSIDGTFTDSDFSTAGHYNVHLAPDPANQFASNANRFRGGSMVYGGLANLWDQGDFSAYGGDTQNTFDGVTMEMKANVPQFIIEGTKSDAITNGYIEYISPFTTSTGDLYGGIVGNFAGSGYGSNTTLPSVAFNFSNNYMIMPSAAGGHTVAALLMADTDWANISNIYEDGNPTYGISFHSGTPNAFDTTAGLNMGYATALYQNPPAPHNRLWWPVDAQPPLGAYNVDNSGVHHFGGINSSTDITAITDFKNSHGVVIPSTTTGVHGSSGVKIQMSDGTGTNAHYAKYDADGNLTDGGTGTGTPTSTWSTDTGGTNTTAPFVVGSGASLSVAGSGTIAATSVPASGVAAGTSTAVIVIGTGGSLTTSGTGSITATAVNATSSISVPGCVGCQHGITGTQTYTTSTTLSLADDGKQIAMNCSAPCVLTLPAVQPSSTFWIPLITSIGTGAATTALGGSDTFNGGTTGPVLPAAIWANTVVSTAYRGWTFATPGSVPDVDVTVPSFAIPANTCYGSTGSTTPATFTMTGLTTAMGVGARDTGDPSAITGWGSSGGLSIRSWASSANTGSYRICNPTSASITGGSITFRMVAQ